MAVGSTAGRSWRIAVRRVRLWMGPSLGLLFVLLGRTGSARVFYGGIDEALHPVALSEVALNGRVRVVAVAGR